jgi:xanthine dehydrogenase iron-sulfur cluster and FAD-binding subunit A
VGAQTTELAQQTLATEIAPIDDIRSTKAYREKVSLNLLEDFLSRISLRA